MSSCGLAFGMNHDDVGSGTLCSKQEADTNGQSRQAQRPEELIGGAKLFLKQFRDNLHTGGLSHEEHNFASLRDHEK